MKKPRPINLDLQTIQLTVSALVSILHRISGVITFVAVGILLWLLGLSLSSPEGFIQTKTLLKSIVFKCILWWIFTAFAYHICSGIRHLLMDFGYVPESLAAGTRSAQIVIVLTLLLSIVSGLFLW